MNIVWLISLLVLLLIGFSAIVVIILWQFKRFRDLQTSNQDKESLLMLNQNIQGVRQDMQAQLVNSLDVIKDVTERLTRLDETNRQVIGFTEQLRQLQDILKNPKQRGVLGEYFLETVLKNVLPPSNYQLQYAFKNGEKVDAAIFVGDKIIPIDAKFSLENYNRISVERDPAEKERLEKLFKQDLKNRIDETAKYIRPEEKTMDFAFMFIPAEAIYYDLLVNQVGAVKLNTRDLIEYAFKDKHVIIVSPTSFFAYLQTVLQGLRALQIEESAMEIRKNVEQLARHLLSYETHFSKLGNQLTTTVRTYTAASNEFNKIDKDLFKITNKKPIFREVTEKIDEE